MLRHALLATKTCNLQWPFARPSVSGTLETLIARTRFSKLRKLDGKHWVKLDKIALAANVFSRLSFGQTLTHERGPQTPNATRYDCLFTTTTTAKHVLSPARNEFNWIATARNSSICLWIVVCASSRVLGTYCSGRQRELFSPVSGAANIVKLRERAFLVLCPSRSVKN